MKIWAWVHSREVFTPADRRAYFQKAKDAGLVGLKIDFPEAPSIEWVNWYDDVLRDAASAQLMIDFHGAVKPTGRERTWPNEMTREAIFGRESGKLPALHDTALPFTRYVQGHADFTPTDFRADRLKGSSYAHELAQAIVYTSPFLCYGGAPANYLENSALDILKAIPATWDETRVHRRQRNRAHSGVCAAQGRCLVCRRRQRRRSATFHIKLDFLGRARIAPICWATTPDNNAAWNRARKNPETRRLDYHRFAQQWRICRALRQN